MPRLRTRKVVGVQVMKFVGLTPQRFQWHWLEDGDHDFKPRVKSGFTHQQHIESSINYLATYIKDCLDEK